MNGIDYERQCVDYLRSRGYRHVRRTGNSSDYGVDIVAVRRRRRYAVQCKFYSRPVGVAAVQQVVGGMAYYNCDKAIVITNNSFTRQARELAERNDVELIGHIRRSGRTMPLLIIFFLSALVLLMFTEYYKYALMASGAAVILGAFIIYLRHQAVKSIRECNTEYSPLR